MKDEAPVAVILAAGMGTRLRPLTDSMPKCLVPVGGRSLLLRTLDAVAEAGIQEAVVVSGYLSVLVEREVGQAPIECRVVYNPHYDDYNNYYSLLVARDAVAGRPFVKLDGDVIFEPEVLRRVTTGPGWIRVGVDVREDLGEEEMKVLADGRGRILGLSKAIRPAEAAGESVGIEYVGPEAADAVFEELARMEREAIHHEYYEFAYDRLARAGRDLRLVDLSDLRWTEIDDLADLERARALFQRG